MTVLSSTDIQTEIANGNIVIRGGNHTIQNCSVDVTLGPHYYRSSKWNLIKSAHGITQEQYAESYLPQGNLLPLVKPHIPGFQVALNPTDPAQVCTFWGQVNTAADNIVIKPGETILAHTAEFIGAQHHITTMLRARSSLGRCNVTVCRDAGWGDIGYINRWCLQITNNNTDIDIVLPVGARIAQIVFLYSSVPLSAYAGQYQAASEIDTIVATWTPASMLPSISK